MKQINKFLVLTSFLLSGLFTTNLLAGFDFTFNSDFTSNSDSNSIVINSEVESSDYQDFDPNPESCPDCDSPPEDNEETTCDSNRISNCSHSCLTIIPSSADYITYKKSSDPLFNDLLNFANELGFTECVGKYLVYKKNTSKLIGFMGLRVNQDLSDKISLLSFESSSLNSILVKFSISSDNITTLSLFDRTSGIEIDNGTVISSYGVFESLENVDWEDIQLIEDLVDFLNYRFEKRKCDWEGTGIANYLTLNETEFAENLRDPDMYLYAIELGYDSFIMANWTTFNNGEEAIFGVLQNMNEQQLIIIDTLNKSCILNFTVSENSISTVKVFTRDKGALLNITDLSIIETWGAEFHSCSSDRCFWACLLDFLASTAGAIWVGICGIACGLSRIACGICLSAVAIGAVWGCTDECNNDPCSHGHVCRPGTTRYHGCSGTIRLYKICNNDGMGWGSTHYDYCPTRHYCGTTSTGIPYQCIPYPQPQAAAHLLTSGSLDDTESVFFSSEGSVDDDGWIVEYYWTFGDGTYSYNANPNHIFCPGSYTVILRVMDNDGRTEYAYLYIRIYDDDSSPPSIQIEHEGTIYDGAPGYWHVTVEDPQSGLSEQTVKVDGVDKLISFSGNYLVPKSLGPHDIEVYAKNNDYDGCANDQEDDSKTETVTIVDDDTSAPVLDLTHTPPGGNLDSNPGFLEFSITEDDPGSHATGTLTIVGPYDFFYSKDYGEGIYQLDLSEIEVCEIGDYYVTLYAENNDEDRGQIDEEAVEIPCSFYIDDDDKDPPEITITIDEDYNWDPSGTLVHFQFTIDAYDASGYSSIYINIGDYTADFLGPHDAFLPEGIYDLTVTIWDNDNDRICEVDMLSSSESEKGIILDLTPPETVITLDPYYEDDLGNYYVTHLTEFSFFATDNVAGVDYTEYRIVGITEWLPAGLFTLEGYVDGLYSIDFYSKDMVDNFETIKSINVILVSVNVESYISRGQSEIINAFDVKFRKCKQDGIDGFMLVATNPGEIFYNIEVINDWPIMINTLSIDATLPEDFIMKGGTSIHIFLDGIEITNLCDIEGSIIKMYDVAPGALVKVIVHADYGLKGIFYPTLADFWVKSYTFYTEIQTNAGLLSQPGGGIMGTYGSSFDFNAYEKKVTAIAGFVKDEDGNPIANVIVELKLPDGSIQTTVTNSEGLYFFIELQATKHEIRFIYNGIPLEWMILNLLKDEVFWMDFLL